MTDGEFFKFKIANKVFCHLNSNYKFIRSSLIAVDSVILLSSSFSFGTSQCACMNSMYVTPAENNRYYYAIMEDQA